jgi:hypothetical protein
VVRAFEQAGAANNGMEGMKKKKGKRKTAGVKWQNKIK